MGNRHGRLSAFGNLEFRRNLIGLRRRRERESDDGEERLAALDDGESDDGGQSSGEDEEDASSVTMTMSDVDVLDCPICFSPLTIPVYQCANGHTTCSNCFPKLRDKCPSCSEKLGKIRCRAIERIIESAAIPCSYHSYGCSYKLKYINKHLHEDGCSHAPFACPFGHCNFRGTSKKISLHVHQKHKDRLIQFSFNSSFSISLDEDPYCVFLEEAREKTPFVFSSTNDCVKIWCFGSHSGYAYALMAKQGRSSQWFQSSTDKAVEGIYDPPSSNFLQIPDYLFGLDCDVELNVCIWSKKDASAADISKFVCDALQPGLS